MSLDSFVSSFLSLTIPGYSTYRVFSSEEKQPSYRKWDAFESDLAKVIVYTSAVGVAYSMLENGLL